MKLLSIPVGVSDFEEIRRNGYYYVDKSGLIGELLSTTGTKVTLITRPRRFGKTLGMSMLESFFDIRKDNKALFEELEIAKRHELCMEWMNQWPTVFVSFRQVDGLNFNSAYDMLTLVISELYKKHLYLLDSDKLDSFDKEIVKQLIQGTASAKDMKGSLMLLTRLMYQQYGKPVILLIDEYDVPVAKANRNGYYEEMLDVMKGLMQALKDNQALCFAVITGCLKIAKESIFTGLNNFKVYSITDADYDEMFGFNDKEVKKMLLTFHQQEKYDEVKEWYDGYHFGEFDMYCPWDVLNYVYDLQEHEEISQPVSYWRNTSDNAVIRSFLDHKQNLITAKLETLLGGGYIIQKIDENLTYDFDRCSDENFWSVLYLTGYLTRCREKDLLPEDRNRIRDGFTALMIPNEEIREIYRDTIVKWFTESAPSWKPENLGEAIQKEA